MCDQNAACEQTELDTRYARPNEYDEESYSETTIAPKPILLTCEACGTQYTCSNCEGRLFRRRDTRTTVRNNPAHRPTATIGSRKVVCIDCDTVLFEKGDLHG